MKLVLLLTLSTLPPQGDVPMCLSRMMAFVFIGYPHLPEGTNPQCNSQQSNSLKHFSADAAVFPYFSEGSDPPVASWVLYDLVPLCANLPSSLQVAPHLATRASISCLEHHRHIPVLGFL